MTDNNDIFGGFWIDESHPFLLTENPQANIAQNILLASGDAPNTFTLYRNISYKSDNDKPEIRYKISAHINVDPLVYSLPKEDIDAAIESIFQVYEERILIWVKIATDFYEGFEDPDMQDILISAPQYSVPKRFGQQNNVEVWGVVMDSHGRSVSMKVTDQTNPMMQYLLLSRMMQSYDFISRVSGGTDLNNGGALVTYTQLIHNASSTTSKKKSKDKTVDETETTEPVAKEEIKKPEIPHCLTYNEVSELPINTMFEMSIAAFYQKGKYLNIHPFAHDENNNLVPSEDSIYLVRDNDYFVNTILPQLTAYDIDLEDNVKFFVPNESKVVLVATKKLSKQNNVWYAPNSLIKE